MRPHLQRLLERAARAAREGRHSEAISCGEAAIFRASSQQEADEIAEWLQDHAQDFHPGQ